MFYGHGFFRRILPRRASGTRNRVLLGSLGRCLFLSLAMCASARCGHCDDARLSALREKSAKGESLTTAEATDLLTSEQATSENLIFEESADRSDASLLIGNQAAVGEPSREMSKMELLRPDGKATTSFHSIDIAETFAVGVIAASILLCLGLGLGLWLGRKTVLTSASNIHDFQKLTQMFGGLQQWMNGVGRELGDFGAFVNQVTHGAENEKLRQANDQLQAKLTHAQTNLETCAMEAATYLAEARTDALTKLPNRRVFDEDLSRRLAEWKRNGAHISMLLIDIDHFKRFNDEHGHLAGDAVLRFVAETLRKTSRAYDLITRFGGEEFAFLLPGSEDRKSATGSRTRARSRLQFRVGIGRQKTLRDD